MSKSPITCHVLDSSIGKPASNVQVQLEFIGVGVSLDGSETTSSPEVIAQGLTNADGRCQDLLESGKTLLSGIYKMKFIVGPYFEASNTPTFYPYVEITFNYVDPSQHYHIPLLISPFSYTTYRGS